MSSALEDMIAMEEVSIQTAMLTFTLLFFMEEPCMRYAGSVVIVVYHYESFILHWTVLVIRRIKWGFRHD